MTKRAVSHTMAQLLSAESQCLATIEAATRADMPKVQRYAVYAEFYGKLEAIERQKILTEHECDPVGLALLDQRASMSGYDVVADASTTVEAYEAVQR